MGRRMIEQQARSGTKRVRFSLLPSSLFCIIRRIWITLSSVVRAAIYEKLLWVGLYLYVPSLSPRVQRLPFGLYLRKRPPKEAFQYRAEAHTLDMAERFTQIPTPRAIDVFDTPDSSYLLMTQVPERSRTSHRSTTQYNDGQASA
ncbi:hypothetical protein N7472_004944 [Penicillium cf. griseofulvum]|uniref:Uncharacterized protein n=1 Tax=Penicillium cf. griseofulvum TaxID=2972120 RepID=A0A9W9JSQ0_9EURO|nr:hypothetical protein N7472_004944 [Penicillium cf. griseofulvum]KAJ5442514.1 hypothetical protein N7445_005521 [Penicillium cf. griseofulvum]